MRPIDADALDVLTIIGGRMNGKVEFAKTVNEMIQNAPTIDAVPVIRCKDCKYRDNDFCTGRGYPNSLVPDNGFCDKGERRE